MKKTVIAYLHTHWDREWYREYEVFRIRLLRVFDNVLDLLETQQIPCFYFDGQTSALQDYLEIRPEKFNLVKDLIQEKLTLALFPFGTCYYLPVLPKPPLLALPSESTYSISILPQAFFIVSIILN